MDTGTLFLVGNGLKAGAGVGAGYASMQQGKTAQKIANYEAAGYERQADEEVAAAQRQAIEQRKKTDRLISTQIARGAASGSAMSSPGLLDIIGDTAQEGEYRAQADQYVGEQRAAGLKDKANVRRVEGEAARIKGGNAFVGSILESASGLATGMDTYRRNYGSSRSSIGPWRTTVAYG